MHLMMIYVDYIRRTIAIFVSLLAIALIPIHEPEAKGISVETETGQQVGMFADRFFESALSHSEQ